MRVGFIGLGSQGGPMARRIVEGGFETDAVGAPAGVASSRTPTPPPRSPATPAELGAASDLVCLCVVGDDDVRQVLDGETGVLAGLAPGGIVAIHSTVHPDTCREIAGSAAAQGVSVIDAPVSGGAPAVERGHAAGDGRRRRGRRREGAGRCSRRTPTRSCTSATLGAGQVTKILNNLLFSANLGSAISTLELGEALGVPRDRLCEVLNRGSATSKAIGSITMFGGTARGAGADRRVRCCRRTSGTRRASPTQRVGARRAPCSPPPTRRWSRWTTRAMSDDRSGSSARDAWARRWCAASSRPATTCARSAAPTRSARPSPNSARTPVADIADVADGADVVVVCVFTDDR